LILLSVDAKRENGLLFMILFIILRIKILLFVDPKGGAFHKAPVGCSPGRIIIKIKKRKQVSNGVFLLC